jgi:hypothetical protein
MKLYLETTVPNFLFADDSPDKKMATIAFFKWLRICSDELFTSVLVDDEIRKTRELLKSRLLTKLYSVPIDVLPVTEKADWLSLIYIKEGVIPRRFANDALHVAIAVCAKIDIMVSWNMKHMVNVHKVERINQVNLKYGFSSIRIHTPEEVIDL